MEKRTSPVKEEERDVPAAGAGDIEGGEIGKFRHKSRVADRDFAKPTSPAGDQSDSSNKIEEEEEELKSTRAEVGEAREENERLKKVLTRIVKDYQALQMHFFDIVQQQEPPPPSDQGAIDHNDADVVELEPELVSLRLGTSASASTEVHEAKEDQKPRAIKEDVVVDDDDDVEGLTLGLDVSKFGSSSVSHVAPAAAAAIEPPPSLSSDNSSEEAKEQEAAAGEPWPPSKAAAKNSRSAEEEVAPQAQVKRARVSVRARCDTPTMNDGCQWRKYGQKVSKGNPCPRAYYRCTVAPLCPVRKQVQRCAEDMSILITTYEGNHNHPLPISATAMASTTAAAACMLTSGSSSSAPRLSGLISAPSSTSMSSSSSAYGPGPGPGHFYLQNQFVSPSSNSHPTITLDLTNKYNSTSNNFAPRYPPAPTTFNFSSSIDSNPMPSHNWTSSTTSLQPYNNNNNNNKISSSTHHMYSSLNQAYWQRAAATSALPPPAPNNNMSTDTIARAITSDPSFQSALAAAITSYVGARSINDANANANGTNYGSRYLNRSTSLGSGRQGAGLGLLQPPMPVAAAGPKSLSGSPVDDMEQAD